jgi:hypothetical protein
VCARRCAQPANEIAIGIQDAHLHTDLYRFTERKMELGFIGFAVGAPFAVLVAEQLFASGCQLLISMTSAGRLAEVRAPP